MDGMNFYGATPATAFTARFWARTAGAVVLMIGIVWLTCASLVLLDAAGLDLHATGDGPQVERPL